MTFYGQNPGFAWPAAIQLALGGIGLVLALSIGSLKWIGTPSQNVFKKIVELSLYGLGAIGITYAISSFVLPTYTPQAIGLGALFTVPVALRLLWFFSVGVREEEFFRGFLYTVARKHFGRGFFGLLLTLAITSVSFWVMHQSVVLQIYNVPLYRTPAYSAVLLVSGVIYGLVFEMTRYLAAPMMIHIGVDVMIEVARIATGGVA